MRRERKIFRAYERIVLAHRLYGQHVARSAGDYMFIKRLTQSKFIRNGAYDAYDVYFRKAAQVKIATPNKKGVIKIAALDTAVAALLGDGGNAGALGTIANKVGKLAGAVNNDNQIETHPNTV